jgi:peroxiredoxin
MKNKLVVWLGLVFVLSFLMAACSGTISTPQAEEPQSAESVATEDSIPIENVVTEEPTAESVATEEPTTENVATEEPTAESVAMEEPDMTGLPVGETAPDFTLSDGDGNMVNLEEALQENEQVVLVFYFGVECAICMTQLKEIEKDRAKYEELGAQVIAIAVQTDSKAAFSAKVSTAQFLILADIDHAVTEAYGVLDGRGRSNPSVFIIDKDGQIDWSEITHIAAGCGSERVASQTILENLG